MDGELIEPSDHPEATCSAGAVGEGNTGSSSEAAGSSVADGDVPADDGEWEYVYEDELEEGDVWEYLDEGEQDANPLSYRNMQSATDDLNSIYHEGVAVAREIKGAVDDIKGLFDLKGLFKL